MLTIEALIQELGAPPSLDADGARALVGPDFAVAMEQEIAKTILPRHVLFFDKGGLSLRCIAASGKLLEIEGRSVPSAADSAELRAFAARAKSLYVRASLIEPPDGNDPTGTTEDTRRAAPHLGLKDTLRDYATAYICFKKGRRIEAYGDETSLLKLEGLAAHGLLDDQGDPQFAAFLSSDERDPALIACTLGLKVFIVLVAPDAVHEINSTWQSERMASCDSGL